MIMLLGHQKFVPWSVHGKIINKQELQQNSDLNTVILNQRSKYNIYPNVEPTAKLIHKNIFVLDLISHIFYFFIIPPLKQPKPKHHCPDLGASPGIVVESVCWPSRGTATMTQHVSD